MSVQLQTFSETGTECPYCHNLSVFKEDIYKWFIYRYTKYRCKIDKCKYKKLKDEDDKY